MFFQQEYKNYLPTNKLINEISIKFINKYIIYFHSFTNIIYFLLYELHLDILDLYFIMIYQIYSLSYNFQLIRRCSILHVHVLYRYTYIFSSFFLSYSFFFFMEIYFLVFNWVKWERRLGVEEEIKIFSVLKLGKKNETYQITSMQGNVYMLCPKQSYCSLGFDYLCFVYKKQGTSNNITSKYNAPCVCVPHKIYSNK